MPGVLEALQRLPDLGDPYADERSAIRRLLALGEPPGERRASARERALGYIEASSRRRVRCRSRLSI